MFGFLAQILLLKLVYAIEFRSVPPPYQNWTNDYNPELAEFALDFASASYAPSPLRCIRKHAMELVQSAHIPCDYVRNEVRIKQVNALRISYSPIE